MNKIWKAVIRVLSIVLGVFTFTACYGMPMDFYTVKARVTDSETGEPVKGIQVSEKYYRDDRKGFKTEESRVVGLTDKDGMVTISTEEDPINLSLKDIDGADNGLYQDKDITVDGTLYKVDIRIDPVKE